MTFIADLPQAERPIIATRLRRLTDFTGSANLYQLSRPVPWGDEDEGGTTEYVVVSATVVPFSGPETSIFPADAQGKVIDWAEMNGSYRGGLNLSQAIRNAGWTQHTD